ncbi:jmjC domain-containing protein 4 isoform X2 [Selaginella moellendorffii]|uniref:jmjC domain-containing protein 4 isoform X2 n=1 Tax=Selaginella moellendorffii TaxID=88036 RepID=UPI000D1CE7C6|nr:jmjC domain-containing protein 4 isoform X2 [Selaginella moellendorffii]|eukprot:XP_002977533.2 jmjC domain-containing protein 4 isoform X2 [Selaginella moellendorffii]
MGRINVGGCVPVEDGTSLSYQEFRERYLLPNKPVLVTGLMEHWRASRDWVDDHGKPDLEFLARNFGGSKIQVADCGEREFTDQKRLEMTVSEFVTHWKSDDPERRALLYLKDWHFVKEFPDYGAYETPIFFSDDWLNQFLDSNSWHSSGDTVPSSDYRFVYMGPAGTWTPLHADVFRSYSWSGNVCGRKRWHLLPPEQTPFLFDRHKKNTVYDIYGTVDEFPDFSKTSWTECIQNPGDIIFVPSGWYHQVTNLEDVISINHNWFNACNLHWVWRLLEDDYRDTVASIEDVRDISDDFETLCQRNLAANSGMNYKDFVVFLAGILEMILDRKDNTYLSFDLLSVKSVLLNVVSARVHQDLCDYVIGLLSKIQTILETM